MATSALGCRDQTEYQKTGTNPYETALIAREVDKLAAHIEEEVVRQLTPRGPLPTVQTLPAEGVFLKINTSEEECKKIDDE